MNQLITCNPAKNHLLNSLSEHEFNNLLHNLELVTIHSGEIIFDVHEKINYVYFPVSGIASQLSTLENGTCVEVCMIGSEGMIGAELVIGLAETLTQVFVTQNMQAYRLPLKSFRAILDRSGGRRKGEFHKLLLAYIQTVFLQMSQNTSCNKRHSIDQQFTSWLLSCFDRVDNKALTITQESIGLILGVRRESITEAAKKLQELGMINYHRGHIELKNRHQLEHHSCECYQTKNSKSFNTVKAQLAVNF